MGHDLESSRGRPIRDVDQLEDLLSEPTAGVVEALKRLEGDVLVLGVGGKMGPTLVRMAKRASEQAGVARKIFGVSDQFLGDSEARLKAQGIETIQCDLLDHKQLAKLPEAANVVYMVGMKFGATGQEPLTWAINSFLPGLVCERFRASRIAAFSTGNVYPLSPVQRGGAVETDPVGPVGEYAMSCLGRERIIQHFSQKLGVRAAIIRLNYAVEMRYGVLVDLATKVFAGRPIDLTMGNANVIWQGDANAMVLQALAHAASPAFVVNVVGPETVSVHRACEQFGQLMGKEVRFEGTEADSALLSNGQLGHRLFGLPRVGVGQMVEWIADWVMRGGESLGKETHFETRDGKF